MMLSSDYPVGSIGNPGAVAGKVVRTAPAPSKPAFKLVGAPRPASGKR